MGFIAAAFVTSAHGADRPLPWSGGSARVTAFEAQATRIARSLAGSAVSIECAEPAAWRALSGTNGFDPALTWAMTPLGPDGQSGSAVPLGTSSFSPRACRLEDAFALRPIVRGTRTCRHGTTTRLRRVRASRPSRGRARRELVRVPILGECDGWAQKLLAVHVLSHEAMHLAGVVDEAEADCLATQADAFVAMALGANPRFARAMAREYWALYYPSQEPRYRTPQCRDGGTLDLYPASRGWPTPSTDDGLSRRILEFVTEARSSG